MFVSLLPHLTSGENIAADGNTDLSKLEVSLTLTNKFEGLETDADDASARSLLLRWAGAARPAALSRSLRPGKWPSLKWPFHLLPGSLILPKVLPEA